MPKTPYYEHSDKVADYHLVRILAVYRMMYFK